MRKIIPIILLALLGCNQSADENSLYNKVYAGDDYEEASEELQMDKQSRADEPVQSIERKLIKTGDVVFETTDRSASYSNINDAVKKYNGYYSSETEYKSTHRISNRMVIRVPAKSFDNLLTDISTGVDHFDRKDIQVQDVTEEFVDIQARLKTKKELELRYLSLLDKAKTVSEMLEIEREIGNLRSAIESIEGRLKYLQSQVGYSTLSIDMYEVIGSESKFGLKVKQGLGNGWSYLVGFVLVLVNVWPFIVILILLVWFIARRRRRVS